MDKQTDRIVNFLGRIQKDDAVSPDLKQIATNLTAELSTAPVYQSDILIYRWIVFVLGITILATIIGGLFLAFKGDPNFKLPSEIVAIGSAAVGALAGLLAPSPQAPK
jgi:hypothetical protein